MALCYPTETDWSCAYDDAKLDEMRADPDQARRLERAEALAWYSLASLCGFQIGVCPTVIRPCAARCAPSGSWLAAPAGGASSAGLPSMTIGSTFTPHISGGNWVNACGCGGGACDCGAVDEVFLPGPVGSIESVHIDGELIAQERYRVDNGNRLVSLDPELSWPLCQDPTAAVDEAGSFVVSYYRGAAPNELTRYAAGLLAAEFFKACSGSKCKLPNGVTQVVRGGATYEIQSGLFPDGATGIYEVDAVIRIYNPHGLKAPSRVVSPDSRAGGRRQTWGL